MLLKHCFNSAITFLPLLRTVCVCVVGDYIFTVARLTSSCSFFFWLQRSCGWPLCWEAVCLSPWEPPTSPSDGQVEAGGRTASYRSLWRKDQRVSAVMLCAKDAQCHQGHQAVPMGSGVHPVRVHLCSLGVLARGASKSLSFKNSCTGKWEVTLEDSAG